MKKKKNNNNNNEKQDIRHYKTLMHLEEENREMEWKHITKQQQ